MLNIHSEIVAISGDSFENEASFDIFVSDLQTSCRFLVCYFAPQLFLLLSSSYSYM